LHCGHQYGALTGGLYALGYSPAEIENFLASQDWNSIFSDAPQRRFTPLIERKDARYQAKIAFRGWNPEMPSGLWGGQRLTEGLDVLTTSRMLSAQNDFDKLPIRFRAVATNLIDGKPYIFKKAP
jgi:NTE family protein